MTSLWNKKIMTEMVWHLSVKQGVDREVRPDLWALCEGNSRGLKQAQKCFYNSTERDEAMDKVRQTIQEELSDYNDGEYLIKSQDDDMSEWLTEGYVQGLLRSWAICTDDPVEPGEDSQEVHEPPQDLSGSDYKDVIEVTSLART